MNDLRIGKKPMNLFKNSAEFSTSTKLNEFVFAPKFSAGMLQYISNFLNATTPENKNLWLSIIENTGDSVVNILTLKNEENRNIWLSWLKDQFDRLDRLSQDLVCDIESKILNMNNQRFNK